MRLKKQGEQPANVDREENLEPEELDAELDVGIDGSFPASDPPSIVSPKRPPDGDGDRLATVEEAE